MPASSSSTARPRPAGRRCSTRTSSSTSSARSAANASARRRSSCSIRTATRSPDGEVGELYASNPYIFDGYWKLPEKTAEAFRGDYCTVGDMARRDDDGYIHLVDRKSNMIITGGENVYPSDVEALIGGHPSVHDVAVVGLPDDKWGERVHAVIVLAGGGRAGREQPHRMVQDAHGRLQASALVLVHARRGHAAHRDRQDPAPQAEGHAGRLKSAARRSRRHRGRTRWRRASMT